MDIELKNISKHYDGKYIFNNISYTFKQGERYLLTGASGSGKTTLLNVISGLLKPDEGIVTGINPSKISYVFQEDRLVENLTVSTNIGMVLKKSDEKLEIDNILKAFGLSGYAQSPVKNLSGGMKRRVAIARALLYDFEILLMDEPFKGLDAEIKKTVIGYITNKTLSKTVIWVTHDATETVLFNSFPIKFL